MSKLVLCSLVFGLMASSALAQSDTTTTKQAPVAPAAPAAPAATATAPAAVPAAAPATAAPAPAIKHVTMRSLLSSGYEIKAVTLVPQDVSSRVARAFDVDAAMVTLQKGSGAATCYFSVEQYSLPGMLDISWCIEQK
jgi:hypothetical protein